MARFIITRRSNAEYQFNLKADNGQVILTSEGYSALSACMNGIESVKKNSQSSDRFDRRTSRSGTYYFVMKAGNGQIIGSSEMYVNSAARDNGISAVMNSALRADVQNEAF